MGKVVLNQYVRSFKEFFGEKFLVIWTINRFSPKII